ncbi:integrase catalytic domain-containing protein [Trichonephila clavipes]|uniref:Integrase catalytic domain-containing protein n=1 Tax=Trichonephila clavipes TaxID=2585209 RepID=A0A8X6W6K6_TRICX|nr:integrase catalytic domain-containing protein [Trichonephila clavipes]
MFHKTSAISVVFHGFADASSLHTISNSKVSWNKKHPMILPAGNRDNATNFTGASAELKHLYKLVIIDETTASLFASKGIKWKFLLPRAPNVGGLWEAEAMQN